MGENIMDMFALVDPVKVQDGHLTIRTLDTVKRGSEFVHGNVVYEVSGFVGNKVLAYVRSKLTHAKGRFKLTPYKYTSDADPKYSIVVPVSDELACRIINYASLKTYGGNDND